MSGMSDELNSSPSSYAVNGTVVCVRPFSQKGMHWWFQRVETQFRLAGIADEVTKADLVITTLPEEVLSSITPWLQTQAGPVSYGDLKNELISRYSLPVHVRAQRLLDLVVHPMRDADPYDAWAKVDDLIHLPGFDADGRRKEISLSREIFLRCLRRDVREQIGLEAYTLPMDALVSRAQSLHEAVMASITQRRNGRGSRRSR